MTHSLRTHLVSARSRSLALAVLFGTPAVLAKDVATYHNDNFRSGQNVQETIQTPSNVTSSDLRETLHRFRG